MTTLDDVLKDTVANRQASARTALEEKRAATSEKMKQTVSSTFLQAAKGLMETSSHSKKGLQLLSPYFALAMIYGSVVNGILENASISKKLGENESPSGPSLGVSSSPANMPQAPTGPQLAKVS